MSIHSHVGTLEHWKCLQGYNLAAHPFTENCVLIASEAGLGSQCKMIRISFQGRVFSECSPAARCPPEEEASSDVHLPP